MIINSSRKMVVKIMVLSAFILAIIIMLINSQTKKIEELNARYEETILRLATSYLETKYEEKIVVKAGMIFVDDAPAFDAYLENNPQVEFRICDWGMDRGFRDNYLESHSEWEAETIVSDIVKNYSSNYSCHAILKSSQETKDALLNYYTANKKHLSWYDEEHMNKLGTIVIRIYSYDESTIKEKIVEPILSEIFDLNFVIEDVSFYLHKNDKKGSEMLSYRYADGVYLLD